MSTPIIDGDDHVPPPAQPGMLMKSLKLAWLAAHYPDRIRIPFVRRDFFTVSGHEQIDFSVRTYTKFYRDAKNGKADLEAFDAAVAGKGFSDREVRNMRRELEYQNKKALILGPRSP